MDRPLNTAESIFNLGEIVRELGSRVHILSALRGLNLATTSGQGLLDERRFDLATTKADHEAATGPHVTGAGRSKRGVAVLSEAASDFVARKFRECHQETEAALKDGGDRSSANYALREAVKGAVLATSAVGLKPVPPKPTAVPSTTSTATERKEGNEGDATDEVAATAAAARTSRDVYSNLLDACTFSVSRIAMGTPGASTVQDERARRVEARLLQAAEEGEKLRRKLENERAKRSNEVSDIDALIAKTREEINALQKQEREGVDGITRVVDEETSTLLKQHQTKDAALKAQLAKAAADLAKLEEGNETAFLKLSKGKLNAKSELSRVISEYDEAMALLTSSISQVKAELERDKEPLAVLERYFSLIDLDRRVAKEEREKEEARRRKEKAEREERERVAGERISRFVLKKRAEKADEKKGKAKAAGGKGKGGGGGKAGAKGGKAAAAGGSPEKKAAKKK